MELIRNRQNLQKKSSTQVELSNQSNYAFEGGEWFQFRIHYGFINASYASLTLSEKEYNGIPVINPFDKNTFINAFIRIPINNSFCRNPFSNPLIWIPAIYPLNGFPLINLLIRFHVYACLIDIFPNCKH